MSASSIRVLDIPERCGNAPRKAVLRDFMIDLYERDGNKVLERLHEDVSWQLMGRPDINGHDEVVGWLQSQREARALRLHTVITHGTECAADGIVTYQDGSQIAFNHVFMFAGHAKTAKIKTIRSYLVSLNDQR